MRQPFSFETRPTATSGRFNRSMQQHSLNISAGVWKLIVLRGLSFNYLAIALS